jgi:hypothetical protein
MENWIGKKFTDIGGGLFEITYKTGNKFTIKIIKSPKQGELSVANPKWKLSNTEFVMTENKFNENLQLGNITFIYSHYGIKRTN